MFYLFHSCSFSCSLSLLWSIHISTWYHIPFIWTISWTLIISQSCFGEIFCVFLFVFYLKHIHVSFLFNNVFSCGLETLVAVLPLNILKMLFYSPLCSLFLIWKLSLYLSFSSLSFLYSIYFFLLKRKYLASIKTFS